MWKQAKLSGRTVLRQKNKTARNECLDGVAGEELNNFLRDSLQKFLLAQMCLDVFGFFLGKKEIKSY